MTVRVEVRPELLRWARVRSGIGDDVWGARFPRFEAWVSGDALPTLRQLQEFAQRTYTPVGFLLLDEPPNEEVPIADFRTVGDRAPQGAVTADLLDVVYLCQARQEWYRDHQLLNGEASHPGRRAGGGASSRGRRAADGLGGQGRLCGDHRGLHSRRPPRSGGFRPHVRTSRDRRGLHSR